MEALDIRRNSSQDNHDTYQPVLAKILDNLGKLHFILENKTISHKYFNESLAIYRNWYKKYSKLYATKLFYSFSLTAMSSKENPCLLFKEALSLAPSEDTKQFVLEKGAKCRLQD